MACSGTSKGIGWKPWLESWYCKMCIHELNFLWKPGSIFIRFFVWFSTISSLFLSIAPFTAEDEGRKFDKDLTGHFGGERAAARAAAANAGAPQPTHSESWTSKWGSGRHFILQPGTTMTPRLCIIQSRWLWSSHPCSGDVASRVIASNSPAFLLLLTQASRIPAPQMILPDRTPNVPGRLLNKLYCNFCYLACGWYGWFVRVTGHQSPVVATSHPFILYHALAKSSGTWAGLLAAAWYLASMTRLGDCCK